MATAKRFEDLEIWQMSRKLVNQVYEITNRILQRIMDRKNRLEELPSLS